MRNEQTSSGKTQTAGPWVLFYLHLLLGNKQQFFYSFYLLNDEWTGSPFAERQAFIGLKYILDRVIL